MAANCAVGQAANRAAGQAANRAAGQAANRAAGQAANRADDRWLAEWKSVANRADGRRQPGIAAVQKWPGERQNPVERQFKGLDNRLRANILPSGRVSVKYW